MRVRKLFAVAVLLGFSLLPGLVPAEEKSIFDTFSVAQPAQRLLAPVVKGRGLDKRVHELVSYKGKLVLLHFWATFCLPCIDELPQLQNLWQQRQVEGLEVLSIALDRGSSDVVQEMVNKLSVRFPVIVENQRQIREHYEIYAMPITYFISRDSRIIGRVVGARDWASTAGQQLITKLLKEQ